MVNPMNILAFYDVFRDISSLVHSSTRVDEVLEVVVWKATEMLNAKGAIVRILNLETHQLELNAAFLEVTPLYSAYFLEFYPPLGW